MNKILIALLYSSCIYLSFSCVDDESLTINRQNYTGEKFRIDGYYHTDIAPEKCIEAMFFYSNGIVYFTSCYHCTSEQELDARLTRNNAEILDLKEYPTHWAIFVVEDNILTIEGWDEWMGQLFVGRTLKRYTCEILNDTTIRVKTIYHSNTEKTETLNEIRRFRQYSNKPDSTNKFISRSKLTDVKRF